MKKAVFALVPMLLWSSAALASDGAADQRWDGVYGGVHLGVGRLSGTMTAYTPYNSYEGFPVHGLNDTAFLGGVQLGYNHQMGNVVVGIEATASLTDVKKAAYTDGLNNSPSDKLFWRKTGFTATLAPRIGYAAGPLLVTAKGGLAVADFKVGHDQNGTDIESKKTQYGYVLGAGVEYALTPQISAGVQYDYENFGHNSQHIVGPDADIFIAQGGDLHAAKVVVNYKF